MPPHGGLRERLLPAGDRVEEPIPVCEAGRHVPGEAVYLVRRVTQSPRRNPDGAPQGEGAGSGGDGRPVPLVAPTKHLPDLVPPLGVEVQVYVRGILPPLVQKPLEEEP